MTEEQKQRLLEQHEERAKFRDRYGELNLLQAKQASDALRALKGG